MPWIEIAVGVGIALLVGLLALVYFADRIGYARGLKQIAAVGAVSIAQAPDGQPIRITGRVRLIDGGLTSPVSQRPCAAWRRASKVG